MIHDCRQEVLAAEIDHVKESLLGNFFNTAEPIGLGGIVGVDSMAVPAVEYRSRLFGKRFDSISMLCKLPANLNCSVALIVEQADSLEPATVKAIDSFRKH